MATEPALSVLVCDDHVVFAEALADALRRDDGFDEVRWAASAAEALHVIEEMAPDLAIVDLRMPDVSGTELITAIKARDEPPRVLVLSVAADVRSVIGVFEAGADGFLGKHESFAAVIEGARNVALGGVPISASAFARLLPRLVPDRAAGGLTGREESVLELLAEQRSNDQIADQLGISPNTVRNHVSSILGKLGVENRGQAVAKARRRGIIPEQA